MVVIVIIGLLATLVVPNVVQKLFIANEGKARADIVVIVSALNDYAVQNGGKYPDSLEVLVTPDERGFKYLDFQNVPKDPWKNEYLYDPPRSGQKYRVYSYGADGAPGGEGKDADIDDVIAREG
jgi:general secretion pathway protein G